MKKYEEHFVKKNAGSFSGFDQSKTTTEKSTSNVQDFLNELFFETNPDDLKRKIYMIVWISEGIFSKSLEDKLIQESESFTNCFRYGDISYDNNLKEYFDSFFLKMIEFLKNNKEQYFNRELNFIYDLVEKSNDKNVILKLQPILKIIWKFQNYANEKNILERHHKNKLFELWEIVFFAGAKANAKRVGKNITQILLNGTNSNFWKHLRNDDIEKTLTYLFKSTDSASFDFFNGYMEEISLSIGKTIYHSDNTKKETDDNESSRVLNLCIRLLKCLLEDSRKELRDYYHPNKSLHRENFHKEIYDECVRKTMLLASCILDEQKEEKEPYVQLFKMLDKDSFSKHILHLHKDDHYNLSIFKDVKYDRHGTSGASFIPRMSTLWVKLSVYFIKAHGDVFSSIENISDLQEIDYYFLVDILRELQGQGAAHPHLKKIIIDIEKNKNEQVTNAPVEKTKFDNFVDNLRKGYHQLYKLSDYAEISHEEASIDNASGYYFEEERTHYIDGSNYRKVYGTDRLGGELTQRENDLILKEIKCHSVLITLNKLFKDQIKSFIENNDYVLLTNFLSMICFQTMGYVSTMKNCG